MPCYELHQCSIDVCLSFRDGIACSSWCCTTWSTNCTIFPTGSRSWWPAPSRTLNCKMQSIYNSKHLTWKIDTSFKMWGTTFVENICILEERFNNNNTILKRTLSLIIFLICLFQVCGNISYLQIKRKKNLRKIPFVSLVV